MQSLPDTGTGKGADREQQCGMVVCRQTNERKRQDGMTDGGKRSIIVGANDEYENKPHTLHTNTTRTPRRHADALTGSDYARMETEDHLTGNEMQCRDNSIVAIAL